jgi:hypothetical protein
MIDKSIMAGQVICPAADGVSGLVAGATGTWSWRLPGSRPCETTDLPRMRGPASCPAFRIHTWFTVEGLK